MTHISWSSDYPYKMLRTRMINLAALGSGGHLYFFFSKKKTFLVLSSFKIQLYEAI